MFSQVWLLIFLQVVSYVYLLWFIRDCLRFLLCSFSYFTLLSLYLYWMLLLFGVLIIANLCCVQLGPCFIYSVFVLIHIFIFYYYYYYFYHCSLFWNREPNPPTPKTNKQTNLSLYYCFLSCILKLSYKGNLYN